MGGAPLLAVAREGDANVDDVKAPGVAERDAVVVFRETHVDAVTACRGIGAGVAGLPTFRATRATRDSARPGLPAVGSLPNPVLPANDGGYGRSLQSLQGAPGAKQSAGAEAFPNAPPGESSWLPQAVMRPSAIAEARVMGRFIGVLRSRVWLISR